MDFTRIMPSIRLIAAVLVLSIHSASATDKIPLIKCCPDGEQYRTGVDYCRSFPDENITQSTAIVIYSITENENLTPTLSNLENFEMSYNFTTCPHGEIVQYSTDFQFYENGTVRIRNTSLLLEPGTFCLNNITTEPGIAVRFCIPNPCLDGNCVRKCCPEGMVVNRESRMCQKDFSIQFNITSQAILAGAVPQCENPSAKNLIMKLDSFRILPDGRMYSFDYACEFERSTEQYCIDNWIESNNTTNTYAMRCFPEFAPPVSESELLSYSLYPSFLGGSAVFLIATFAVYALIPELRNLHGVVIMCYVASMAMMFITLSLVKLSVGSEISPLCHAIAVVTHYFFLSAFTWLNVVCFDVWWTFRNMKPRSNVRGKIVLGPQFKFYSAYGWGVPFIIVLIGQIADNLPHDYYHVIRPGFALGVTCWFLCREGHVAYLYAPLGVLVFSNLIFFFMTFVVIQQAGAQSSFAARKNQTKERIQVTLSLFVLMGVTWILEVIGFAVGGDSSRWFASDILNILTGVFIFIIFICKPKVWKLMQTNYPFLKRLCCSARDTNGKRSSATSNTKTSSDSRTKTSRATATTHDEHEC